MKVFSLLWGEALRQMIGRQTGYKKAIAFRCLQNLFFGDFFVSLSRFLGLEALIPVFYVRAFSPLTAGMSPRDPSAVQKGLLGYRPILRAGNRARFVNSPPWLLEG